MAARSRQRTNAAELAPAAAPWYRRRLLRSFMPMMTVGVLCFLAGLLCGNYLEESPLEDLRSEDGADPVARHALRMPGEFEPQEALVLSCAQMVQFHPQTLVDIVSAVHDHIEVLGLAGMRAEEEQARELLRAAGLPEDAMRFVRLTVESMWVRDYGPVFVVDGEGNPRIADGRYLGGEHNPQDDLVPVRLAERMGMPRDAVPLTFEGGNLLSNGRGFCLSASTLVGRNEQDRGYDKPTIDRLLFEHFGFTGRAFLRPLQGEPTQHIDMYATFVAPDLLVLGDYEAGQDSVNGPLLDAMAEGLAGQYTAAGPLRVARIPMPPHDDGLWRTYTNVIFANDVLLVPVYPETCPELDRRALQIYRGLLPGWEVVGIDATSLISRRGALHCVSVNVPVLDEPSS